MNRVLYNVTVNVDYEIHGEWLDWMKIVHIPDVMSTGFFLESRICRIHEFEEGGVTYAVQYIAKSMKDLQAYNDGPAEKLQLDHSERYGMKVAAFRTVLEIIHEFKPPISEVNPN
jgi:hypothetical protein